MATRGDFSRTLEGGHEPFYDFPCSLCEKDDKHVEAVKYCKDCFVYMCNTCVVNHDKFPLHANHLLLNQKQFATVTKSKPVSFPTKRCQNHPGELMSIYCWNHDIVCCSSCKVLEHSNCAKTQHLIDAAKGVQISREYKNIKKETDILMTDVVKILADRKADISRIDNEKQNIKQIIADFRKKVNKYFDDLEEQSLDELNNKAAIIVRACEQDTKDLAILKSKAEDTLKQLESFKGDNECDLFVQVKTGTQFLRNAMNKVITISKSVQKDDITFRIDPRIEPFLSSIEGLGTFTDSSIDSRQLATVTADKNISQPRARITSPHTSPDNLVPLPTYKAQLHGKVNVKEKSGSNVCKNISQPRARITSPHTSPDNLVPLPTYKAQLHGKVDVKEKSDSYVCYISGICQLSDGTILITDNDNMKLKRLDDKSYKLLDSLRLPSDPSCVCNAGPGEVAVSLRGAKKVQFISAENKLTMTRSFSTSNGCRGMVYVDGKLYVCCEDILDSSSGCLKVYNNVGQLQHSIPNAPRGISDVPLRITASDDDHHLLVTSFHSDDVTMMDLTGNVINTFSDTNLKAPKGICTDGKGQVFICGRGSSTVVQVEPKQQKIDVILREKNGVKNPWAVCYDRKQSRLLVSCVRSNELLVFSLK